METAPDRSGDQRTTDAAARTDLPALAREMNVPLEALETAVKAVGTDRNRIKDYLTGGAAATQQAG